MTTTNTGVASDIINRAAVELGLVPAADPFSSEDMNFVQLKHLLNTAGEELAQAYDWEFLVKSHQILTQADDSGDYDLPTDFLYMLNQTGWERSRRVPLFGALSAQDWTYLQGRKLASKTIYASFRIQQGKFTIYPNPVPEGLDINFEYQSKNWAVQSPNANPVPVDAVSEASDLILYDKVLISRYLKVKYLEAKGFDSAKAQDDFYQQFAFVTGKEKGAEILRAGGRGRGFPYLDGNRNTPDTGYGM